MDANAWAMLRFVGKMCRIRFPIEEGRVGIQCLRGWYGVGGRVSMGCVRDVETWMEGGMSC